MSKLMLKFMSKLCCLSLCLLLWVSSAEAALNVSTPKNIAQGAALLVRAEIDTPDPVVFSLAKRQISVQPQAEGQNWVALAYFPVGVDDKGPLNITVKSGKQVQKVKVPVLAVKWPRQEIQVDKKYVAPPKAVTERIQQDAARSKEALSTVSAQRYWELDFIRPVKGGVTSAFGGKRVFNGQTRSYHKGVDLRGATGTPIQAMAGGKVLIADDLYFSGNVVYLDHGLGVISIYAHMSELKVQAGDIVQAGQVIGLVGATGRVTGPHLHLSFTILGHSVNPMSIPYVRDANGNQQ